MSFKYANQIIDFLDEKIAGNFDMGEITYEKPINDDDYALVIKTASDSFLKKFPVNNLNNVAFSYASFLKNGEILNPEMRKIAESNIAKRLDFYGLEHDLTSHKDVTSNRYNLTSKDEQGEKRAEVPAEFAHKNKLPIDTPKNLSKSANEFIRQKHLLSVKERKDIAEVLVKKASEFSMDLPSDIYQYSSKRPSRIENMKVAMATRFASYPSKVKDFVIKLVSGVKTAEDALAAAEAVDVIDKKLGIKRSNHLDPAKEFFTTEKTAEELESEKLQRAIESDILNDYLDKDTIELLKEGSNGFNKLNTSDKIIVKKILKNIR